MDPTTTLMTFMLSTSASTRSVKLLGSWDNFDKRYPMEKDTRKGQGEWRGCYSFKDIICDGEDRHSARDGGLKMGHMYYYYYEVDDGIEVHNESLPSTTACPYLPGQSVNILSVPTEKTSFLTRSASVGASGSGVKTLNPEDKYNKPRPLPTPPPRLLPRSNTSTAVFTRRRDSKSVSPVRSTWPPHQLFGPRPLIRTDSTASTRSGRSSPLREELVKDDSEDAVTNFPKLDMTTVNDPFFDPASVPSRQSSTSSTKKPPSVISRRSSRRDSSPPRPPSRALHIPTIYHAPVDPESEDELDDVDLTVPSIITTPIEHPLPSPASPPPAKRQHLNPLLLQLPALEIGDKFLPSLPEDVSPSLLPRPLLPALKESTSRPVSRTQSRTSSRNSFRWESHGLPSPMDIHHDCSSPSLCGYNEDVMDESYFGFSVAGGGVESPAEETEEDEVESGPGGMSPLVGYGLPLGGVDETKNTEDEQLMVLPPIGVADTKDKVSGPPVLPESALPTLTALDELLAEMGYLGDMIN